MSFKFITALEIAFINEISRELIQHVVGQEITYYEISPELSKTNDMYHESISKTWKTAVKINALVKWDNETSTAGGMGISSQYSLEVYFHTLELEERDIRPREGDFVEFGQVFFEITSVTQPQIVFGQSNNKILTKCVCVPSREGQFQAGNNDAEGVDNSHPVENTLYDPK